MVKMKNIIMLIFLLVFLADSQTPYVSLDSNFYLGWEFIGDSITFVFNVTLM